MKIQEGANREGREDREGREVTIPFTVRKGQPTEGGTAIDTRPWQ